MSFFAPLMLVGMIAVSIPIILHFFYKARHRPLPWAAMRFLRLSVEQTSRKLKFQELILLLMRCMALMLLALAFARPSCQFTSSGSRGESVDAILIFDTSYSMGARDGEKTRFERAKDAAIAVIDGLPRNSTVQIYTCSDRVNQIKFTPRNFDQARSIVKNLELTSISGDILPGLNEGYAALDRGESANKEVYVFSDLQKSGWEQQSGAIRAITNDIKKRATLVLVRCGKEDSVPRNIAITGITFPGGIPLAGTRIPFTVMLRNTGKEAISNVAVTLEVDGEKQEIDTGLAPLIEPGTDFPVTLTGKLAKAGSTLLTARIGLKDSQTGAILSEPDDLPGDNRYDKVVNVRDKVRVLLVDGSPDPRDPRDNASHYVRNALQPVTDITRDDYFVKVTVVTPDTVAPRDLGDTNVDICILTNVASSDTDKPGIPGLSTDFVNRLAEFVNNGGSLIIGSGDFVVDKGYNAVLGSRGLLPFKLGGVQETTPEKPFNPSPDSIDSTSFLSKFKEPPYSLVTSRVDIFKLIGMDESDKDGKGRVILRTENNQPVLSAVNKGQGEVYFFHTTLDARWTNWPAKEGGASYFAIVRQLLSHLSAKGVRGSNRVAGETLTWNPAKLTKHYEMIKPDKARVSLGEATGGGDSALTISTTDTQIAGKYSMGYGGEQLLTGPTFAVIPDLRESESLEALKDSAFEQAIGFKPLVISAGSEVESQIGNIRMRHEWTIWLLIAVFIILMMETAWAWFCGREK